jgi:hypothetical protein
VALLLVVHTVLQWLRQHLLHQQNKIIFSIIYPKKTPLIQVGFLLA